jgi:hypothetical protein
MVAFALKIFDAIRHATAESKAATASTNPPEQASHD